MAEFEYRAVGKDEFETGVMRAGSVGEVESMLTEKGLRAVSIEVRESNGLVTFLEDLVGGFGQKMSGKERVLFTEQMASMLKAGLPLIEALEAFVEEDNKGGASKVVKRMLTQIQTGKKLSEVMLEFPATFSSAYVAVVRSGESSGSLAESLEYMAAQLRREGELASKVKSALVYPVVVMVAMVAVLAFISVVVIPKVVEFAQNSGQQLPLFTLLMVQAVDILVKWWPLVLFGFVVIVFLFWMGIRSDTGKKLMSSFLLKLPIVGALVKSYNRARFARLLGGFYKYGVSVVGSFDILVSSLDNHVYKEACARIKNKLVVGQTLAEALEDEGDLFPSIMSRLVKGAERTGELGSTLERLAKYYEDELEVSLKNATVLIEPLLVIFLGVGVVGIALAVIVPVYKVSTGLK